MAGGNQAGCSPASEFFERYQQEILHWNSSMNLISRRGTQDVCRGLLEQCRDCFHLLWSWLDSRDFVAGKEEVLYSDLGSGAGFPGIVWNQLFHQQKLNVRSFLVEPREKRAWFLDRVRKLEQAAPLDVVRGRWGAVRVGEGLPPSSHTAIISLKALFLNNIQVLRGLGVFAPGLFSPAGGFNDVLIVRFYPPDQVLDGELLAELGPPPLETAGSEGARAPVIRHREILGPSKGLLPASLVLTHFGFQ